MSAMNKLCLMSCALLWGVYATAQEAAPPPPEATITPETPSSSGYITYQPSSRLFTCEIRETGWSAFEEEDALGPVVHILGPENPAGNYRTGLSVRWMDKDTPGFLEPKKAVDLMRRADPVIGRSASAIRPLRVGGLLGRGFEVTQPRVLPLERTPAVEDIVHHYIVILPSGTGYYLIRLSSTRDVYLDFRDELMRFLKTFRPMGR
jgi:hypothetical protein